jgi:hypothetical protein
MELIFPHVQFQRRAMACRYRPSIMSCTCRWRAASLKMDVCVAALYDESKLKKSRICVTWLSANTWATGSIYGNVQFAFHWRNQIRRRRCYWVEPMTAYTPKAYRILLTDRDLSQSNRERICRCVQQEPVNALLCDGGNHSVDVTGK